MAEKPDLPTRPGTTSGSAPQNASASLAARHRFPRRQSSRPDYSQSPKPSALDRRRSSLLSYSSFEDASSLADDIVNPRTNRSAKGKQNAEQETTHWHSTPLAFALLPAIGGLLFKNGSSFTTDILLLVLAAIFMNWSIRLPWEWYYSAQIMVADSPSDYEDTILEEDEPDEHAVETASSAEGSPKTTATDSKASTERQSTAPGNARDEAATSLRRQELLALGAIFTFPALAAYLLHVIRAQLTLPSTSLVSDYNICIFVLAAEIMPCRQVIRLIANRTLHLQRTATGLEEPFASAVQEKSAVHDLMTRIADLEGKLANHQIVPPTLSIAQKADVSELSAEMKKRYEPRLEGLERAVRRYEKRSTTLSMLTEQRLNSLETRLQEALSLAAVAAQHSQKRGIVATTLETLSNIISIPLKLVWSICVWPFLVLEDLYDKVKVALLGPVPHGPPKKRPKDGSTDEKPRLKSSMRKVVR